MRTISSNREPGENYFFEVRIGEASGNEVAVGVHSFDDEFFEQCPYSEFELVVGISLDGLVDVVVVHTVLLDLL